MLKAEYRIQKPMKSRIQKPGVRSQNERVNHINRFCSLFFWLLASGF
jgi:hypothetical protein